MKNNNFQTHSQIILKIPLLILKINLKSQFVFEIIPFIKKISITKLFFLKTLINRLETLLDVFVYSEHRIEIGENCESVVCVCLYVCNNYSSVSIMYTLCCRDYIATGHVWQPVSGAELL